MKHFLQNMNGTGFSEDKALTENLTGETGTKATANPKAITGFTFDETVEGTLTEGTITGDGKLVLNLYYTRNSYEVTYE